MTEEAPDTVQELLNLQRWQYELCDQSEMDEMRREAGLPVEHEPE